MTQFIEVKSDIQIAYQVYGQGLPVILIHGLRASKENMSCLALKLAENYQVYVYDIRGHGESTHPNMFTWQDYIDDLYSFIKILNIQKAVVVGHSMGSYIALSFTLQHPQYVSKLVLMASKLEGRQSSTSRIIEQLNLNINQLSSQQLSQIIDSYMYVPETMQATKQLASQLKSPVKLSKKDVQLANEAMKEYNVVKDIEQLSLPTLVLVGRQDGINDIATNQYLANHISKSQLIIIESASHMLQLEQFDEVARQIHQFIQQRS